MASLDVLPSLTRHLSLNTQTSSYWYRLKTLDDLRLLDAELDHSRCPYRRRSIEPLSTFLGRLTHLGLTFNGETVFHLCRLVESARFSRLPYGEVEYREFATLLNEILAVVKRNRHQLKKVAQSESNFPIKTELVLQSKPVIRTRLQNILYKDKSETLL